MKDFNEQRIEEEKLYQIVSAVLGLLNQLDFTNASVLLCMAFDDLAQKYDYETEDLYEILGRQIIIQNRENGHISEPFGSNIKIKIVEGIVE